MKDVWINISTLLQLNFKRHWQFGDPTCDV